MSTLNEIRAVTAISLQSIPRRLAPSLVVIIGVATVIAVFVSVLALASSYQRASTQGGRPDRAIILSAAATTESSSAVSRDQALMIGDLPGIRRGVDGKPIISFEVLNVVPLTHKRTGLDSFVTLRGVGPHALTVREEIKLLAGRMFRSGTNEIIVGRALQNRIAGIELGNRVQLPQGECVVVGTFTSNGDSHESELHMDADTLAAAMNLVGYHSGTVVLESAAAFDVFKESLTANPTLTVTAKREPEYFAEASGTISAALSAIAWFIGGVMAFGATFGLLSIMYSTVAARRREIGTLRALGFQPSAILVSILVETQLLVLIGAGVGAAIAWVLFNGNLVSVIDAGMRAQLTYSLHVGIKLISLGVVAACVIGAIGGVFPALRASRIPVTQALRAA